MSNLKYGVGNIFKSKNCGYFEVIGYKNCLEIEVRFVDTGYITVVRSQNISSGSIKDRYLNSVFSVGVIGSRFKTRTNGGAAKEYKLWHAMLNRCYSEHALNRRETYRGCGVSDNFKSYEYFYEWCNNQVGFNKNGWELDKDLLVKGNKVYSEEYCVFIPQELNKALTNKSRFRGLLPIGVSLYKPRGNYTVSINRFGKNTTLGYFNTPEEAFNTYKFARESYLKELANIWKDQIDPRAYESLINYEVDIDD